MDEIRLPQHVMNRIDQRWAARFAEIPHRASGLPSSIEGCDPLKVSRLLEGAPRPTTRPHGKPSVGM
jgi:hypothetical protein